MEKIRALITKLLAGKSGEATCRPAIHDVAPDNEVDVMLRRLVVVYNEWRDESDGVSDDFMRTEEAVTFTMKRMKSFPEELRAKFLQYQFRTVFDWVTLGKPESLLNEFFAYHEVLSEGYAGELLAGVHRYAQLSRINDFTKADQKTQEQVKALITVARKIPKKHLVSFPMRNDDLGLMIASDEVVQFVMDHSEHAELIADTIMERQTANVDFLHEIINNKAFALSSGTL